MLLTTPGDVADTVAGLDLTGYQCTLVVGPTDVERLVILATNDGTWRKSARRGVTPANAAQLVVGWCRWRNGVRRCICENFKGRSLALKLRRKGVRCNYSAVKTRKGEEGELMCWQVALRISEKTIFTENLQLCT